MDVLTHEFLCRMEGKIDHIINGQKLSMNLEQVDILVSFYEEEVVNEKGSLHHLAKDEKLKAFIDELIQEDEEIEDEDSDDDDEKEEYKNKPFDKK